MSARSLDARTSRAEEAHLDSLAIRILLVADDSGDTSASIGGLDRRGQLGYSVSFRCRSSDEICSPSSSSSSAQSAVFGLVATAAILVVYVCARVYR